MSNVLLSDLSLGDSARISEVASSCSQLKKTLFSFGVIPGETVTLCRFAPLGDPMEIKINGFLLSLRASEASNIKVIPF